MPEGQFIMSQELQDLDRKAKNVSNEARHTEYSYKKLQKEIRKQILRDYDNSLLQTIKELKEKRDEIKLQLKEAKRALRETERQYKKQRRIVTKVAYRDNGELQRLKEEKNSAWNKVHTIFKEFHIKYEEEHNKWNSLQ